MQMLKRWQFWVGVIISAVFLYLALGGLKLRDVWETLRNANYWWLVPGVAVYFVAVGFRSWRWSYVLNPIQPVPARRLFPIVVIGYMGNNVYPARAGEFIRAYILWKKAGINVGATLTTAVLERVFDGLMMLLFVFVALPFAPLPEAIHHYMPILTALMLGASAIFFVLAMLPDLTRRLYTWVIDRVVPQRFREPVRGLADGVLHGLQILRSGRAVFVVFGATLVIWLLETVKYWLVMHCFDFRVSFLALMLVNGVVNLATIIPSAPAYLGTFDKAGSEVMTRFGVPQTEGTSYILLLHAVLWLPVTALGFFFMWRESVSWQDLGVAARIKDKRRDS
jgi:uncharacterized protein (TIRG00374 family)